ELSLLTETCTLALFKKTLVLLGSGVGAAIKAARLMDRTQLGCMIGWEDLVIFMILEGCVHFTIILLLGGVQQSAGAAVCLNDYGQPIQV
uniref:Polyprotein n=1 Tax=Strongyloides papillosus TaxID=174720 RepID=A0A0N5BQ46_STREA